MESPYYKQKMINNDKCLAIYYAEIDVWNWNWIDLTIQCAFIGLVPDWRKLSGSKISIIVYSL